MILSLIMLAATALSSAQPTNATFETAPPMNLQIDSTTRLAVGLAMGKSVYTVGDSILLFLVLQNPTDREVSAFHLQGNVSLSKLSSSTKSAKWGFSDCPESFPSAVSSSFGTLQPGADFQTTFSLAGHRDSPQPGKYRVQIRVTILKSLNDHTPVGVIAPPPIDFSIVPK